MSERYATTTYLLVMLCASIVAGCGVPGQTLRYAPSDPNIIGVRSILAPGTPVDVVLVHGMCYHDISWVDGANQGLADALGLTITQPSTEPIPIGSYDGKLYRRHLTGPKGELVRTFAILWSPVAENARAQLCYDANQPTDSCKDSARLLGDRRAYVNALLKNEIMDGCLADAVYSVGKEGIDHIGSTVEAGLTLALAGRESVTADESVTLSPLQSQTAPLFIVTESLGSKLFVDAAIRMASRSCPAYRSMADTIGRTAQIFMEANQIPILTLAYNPALDNKCVAVTEQSKAPQATGLSALVELRKTAIRTKEALATPLRVAAFSDPNDILSYTLVPYHPAGLEVADIVLVNDWVWLALFENPYNAHTTYRKKCRVQRVIADGTAGLTESCAFLQ